jgi:hypothetical protein
MTIDGNYVEGLDVKYLVGGGSERNIDPAIVSPFETLERNERKRRGREFLLEREEDIKKKETTKRSTKNAKDALCKDGLGTAGAETRETASSRQSITTYSSPQKQNVTTQMPKKVTPIPKMVKVGMAMDSVSPMTDERLPSVGTKKKNVKSPVPRGLRFDKVGDDEDKEDDKKMTATKKIQSSLPKTSEIIPTKRRQVQARNDTSSDDVDRKPAAKATISAPTSSNRPNASSEKAIAGVRLNSSGMIPATVAKKVSKLSFARTTSAYNKDNIQSSSKESASSRKPLLDVYREEVKKAREFMDEMVGPPRIDQNLGQPGLKENARFIRTSS